MITPLTRSTTSAPQGDTPPFKHLLSTNHAASTEEADSIRKICLESEAEIAKLDIEIDCLESVREQYDDVSSFVAAHRKLLSPIRHLPQSVLQTILILCLPLDRNPVMHASEAPLSLGRVCRSWREVIHDTAELWSAVHVVIPSHFHPEIATTRLTALRTWLSRSGECPLSISVYAQDKADTSVATAFLSALVPFYQRWKQISFILPPPFILLLELLLKDRSPEHPNLLRSFELSSIAPVNQKELTAHDAKGTILPESFNPFRLPSLSPFLERCSVIMHTCYRYSSLGCFPDLSPKINTSNLLEFTFEYPNMFKASLRNLAAFLLECKNIRRLKLLGNFRVRDVELDSTVILLPKLEDLDLQLTAQSDLDNSIELPFPTMLFLQCLICPSLTRLAIWSYKDSITFDQLLLTVSKLSNQSGCHLQTLSIEPCLVAPSARSMMVLLSDHLPDLSSLSLKYEPYYPPDSHLGEMDLFLELAITPAGGLPPCPNLRRLKLSGSTRLESLITFLRSRVDQPCTRIQYLDITELFTAKRPSPPSWGVKIPTMTLSQFRTALAQLKNEVGEFTVLMPPERQRASPSQWRGLPAPQTDAIRIQDPSDRIQLVGSLSNAWSKSPFQHLFETNSAPSVSERQQIHDLCSAAEVDMTKLAHKVHSSALLRERRQGLASFVAAHRAVLSPLRGLAPEILQIIFLFCLPTDRNPMIHATEFPALLGRVCKRWREIVYHTVALWARIHVVVPSYDDQLARTRLSILSNWLSRSGDCPLSISIYVEHYSNDDLIAQLLDMVVPLCRRWQRISFCMHPKYLMELESLLKQYFKGHALTLLRSVEFRRNEPEVYMSSQPSLPPDTNPFYLYTLSPSLTHSTFILPVYSGVSNLFPTATAASLQDLSFEHDSMLGSFQRLLAFLSECKNIRRLRIYTYIPVDFAENGFSPRMITLPNLEDLDIDLDESDNNFNPTQQQQFGPSHTMLLLEQLTCPSLTRLAISPKNRSQFTLSDLVRTVSTFVTRSACCIEKLALLCLPEGQMHIVKSLLTDLRDLSDLQISIYFHRDRDLPKHDLFYQLTTLSASKIPPCPKLERLAMHGWSNLASLSKFVQTRVAQGCVPIKFLDLENPGRITFPLFRYEAELRELENTLARTIPTSCTIRLPDTQRLHPPQPSPCLGLPKPHMEW